jgi:radical SAM superfamily enzyme YgiQ (UPF0313 family)
MNALAPPRLLLINPWIFDFTAYDLWSKPLGLLYVASTLREAGYTIDYIDCLDKYHPELLKRLNLSKPKIRKYGAGPLFRQVENKPGILDFVPRHFARYGLPEDIFVNLLRRKEKPSAILVTSLMTYWYLGPKRVVELLRKVFPGVPVILGGIYAALLPDHAWKTIRPDYIIEGPGEIQVLELLREILPNAPEIRFHPKVLDDFPPPAFDLYSHLDYLIVMTSRGCPYRCTFCATDKISGGYAQRQPDKVVDEISQQANKYRVKDVAFYDDALLLNKKNRLIPILKALLQSEVNLRFHTPNGLHAKQIDEELAELFYLSNFKTIRLSFETAEEQRLADMQNKVTPDDLLQAVSLLEKAGYQRKSLEAYVMMGLPNQNLEEVYRSILFVNSMGIKVRLASFSPIPGTVDYNRAVQASLFPADADPLLTNKSVYPLHRIRQAFLDFRQIRQFVAMLNSGLDRGVNLLGNEALKNAVRKFI